MRRPILTTLAVLVLSTACGTAQPKPASPPASAAPLLDLRLNPLMDLHYWVRRLGAERAELPAVEGLSEAVAATRQAGSSLGDVGLWGVLVGSFTEATTAEELARVATEVPETFTLRDGRTIPVRQSLASLAAAYRPLEKSFLADVWPRHREIGERAVAALREQLLPKIQEVYADLSRHLGAPVPGRPLPVYLVAAAPSPGAFSMRSQDGPFSVVALEGEPDSQWVEIVIHESIHALDVQAGEGSVLAELRRRLEQVPGASPREVHDFVHTVMFAQAAGTVRRVLDPNHRDYGDVKGYYARAGRAAEVVVPAWREYLDGKVDREVALERIVAGFSHTRATTPTPAALPRGSRGAGRGHAMLCRDEAELAAFRVPGAVPGGSAPFRGSVRAVERSPEALPADGGPGSQGGERGRRRAGERSGGR